MSNSPKLILLSVNEVELLDENPRDINQKEFEALCEDIKNDPNFLQQRPPLVNHITEIGKKVVYAGNQRLKAARQIGLEKIYFWVEENVSKEVQEKRMLQDNLHRGEWNFEKLKLFDFDTILSSGFKIADLGPLFEKKNILFEDKVSKGEAELTTKNERNIKDGDIFQLGKHRLICGDSSDKEILSKLLKDTSIDILYTDPPYNIGLSYDKGIKGESTKKKYTDKLFSDDKKPHDYKAWLLQIIHNARIYLKQDAHVFIWCDPKYIGIIQEIYELLKIKNKSVCFWIKNQFNPVTNMAFNRITEPCVYGTIGSPWLNQNSEYKNYTELMNQKISGKDIFGKLQEQLDIWVVSREFANNYKHPTQKPITLHEKPFNRCTKPSDKVLDVFGGSGSTLIACEQMDRICFTIEKDPIFCNVIIQRWEDLTNLNVKKLN